VRVIDINNKPDLRSVKTDKALDDAIYELLRRRNFRKITVNDICMAAPVSRAAFYARYTDKYDLLENWLARFCPQNNTGDDSYGSIETIINEFVYENKAIIKNIINEADQSTLDVLIQLIISFMNLSEKTGSMTAKTVQQSVYAGGIVNYIIWQVKNNFPDDVKPMNRYLYRVIVESGKIDS